MTKNYTLEEKRAAVRYVDEHPDVDIYEAASRLKIKKNTLYAWTSEKGRAKIFGETRELLGAAANERSTAAIVRPLTSVPRVTSSAAAEAEPDVYARIRALEIENAHLRKLVAIYREMTGI